MAHLGAGKGELWVVLHQTDNRDPAASTFPDSLLIWPQPGCRDRHTALPWLLLGTSTIPGCLGKADSLGNGACTVFQRSTRENATAKCYPLTDVPNSTTVWGLCCLSVETKVLSRDWKLRVMSKRQKTVVCNPSPISSPISAPDHTASQTHIPLPHCPIRSAVC